MPLKAHSSGLGRGYFMDYEVLMKESLKGHPERIKHTLGVRDRALELGKLYHANLEVLNIASLLHDITKYWTDSKQIEYINDVTIIDNIHPAMYHSVSAYFYAKSLGITNPLILEAIRYHMWGKIDMSLETMILSVSDYCEENRTHEPAKKVYELALKDLTRAYLYMVESTIQYLMNENIEPHIDQINTYNYYLKKELNN